MPHGLLFGPLQHLSFYRLDGLGGIADVQVPVSDLRGNGGGPEQLGVMAVGSDQAALDAAFKNQGNEKAANRGQVA